MATKKSPAKKKVATKVVKKAPVKKAVKKVAAKKVASKKTVKKEYGMQGFPDLKAKQTTDANHKAEVGQAIKDGQVVPPEVLADYPDLKSKETPAVAGEQKTPASAVEPPVEQSTVPRGTKNVPQNESQPEMVGLGAATEGEVEPSPKTPTSIKNAVVDEEREARGLPKVIEPARRSFGKVWDDAMATVDKDPDAQTQLINELRDKPRAITDKEDAMLLQRQIDLQNEYGKATRDMAQAYDDSRTAPSDEARASRAADVEEQKLRVANLSDQLLDLYNINKRVGTETGRGLNARKMMAYEDYSLAGMETRLRAAKDGEALTPQESTKVKTLSDTVDRLQRQIDEYQTRVAPDSTAPRYSDYVIKIAEKIVSTLDTRADAARARLRDKLGRVNALIDPTMLVDLAEIGASHLAHVGLDFAKWSKAMVDEFGDKISPHLKNLYEMSQRKADAISEQMAPKDGEVKRAVKKQASANSKLQAVKTRYANRAEELKAKMAAGDLTTKPRVPVRLDPEGQRLKAQYENAKLQFDRMVMAERLKNRTMLQKTQDTFVKWRRAFVLSSPVTLAKLTSAAIERYVFTPTEEAVGSVIGKVIPSIAAKAPREGGFNVNAEAKSLTEGFTKGMQDSWNTLTTGHSDMDSLFGKRDVMPRSAIDLIGSIHGALKAPVKRAEFTRSFEKRVAFAIRNGQDVSDPMVQTRICVEAYKDANRSIFMQDNKVTAAWHAGIAILKAPDKATGKVPIGRRTIATGMQVMMPIVKVPTNIVAETMQYALGSVMGTARLGGAIYKGIENLKPEEADLIMRELKKGSLGAALLLTGYLSPGIFGGYYQQNDRKRLGHPKFGTVDIAGHIIPSMLIHNPLLETLQIGATIRHVADSKLRVHDRESQGPVQGAIAGALGLTDEVPFVRQTTDMLKVMNPYERDKYADQVARDMIVPLGISWVAKHFDKNAQGQYIARDPKNLAQTLESAIPLLRQRVPENRKKTLELNRP